MEPETMTNSSSRTRPRKRGPRAHQRATADDLMVEALAQGMNYPEAGRFARVSARTVQRRMADPGFSSRVSVRHGERMGELTGRLSQAGAEAVAVIQDAMGADQDPKHRLTAATVALRYLHQFHTDLEVEQRLQAVEAIVTTVADRVRTS